MKKINNSGFVLVETLIVSVIVMVIFSILYTNFYPMLGEYERRENYDDIDSKYAAFWIKRIVQSDKVKKDELKSKLDTSGGSAIYIQLTKDYFTSDNQYNYFFKLIQAFNVNMDASNNPIIYITRYNLGNNTVGMKQLANTDNFTRGVNEYIKYLPSYSTPSINNAQYRLIAQFHRTKDDNDFYTYSTIEVIM